MDTILSLYETVDPLENVSQSRVELYLRFLDRAAKRTGIGMKLLDVGCSSGTFLELAAENGWRAYGIEPSNVLAERARNKGLQVETGVLA